jgi:ubiquinone/menaquinone biosynthesis C-methylase UbiE
MSEQKKIFRESEANNWYNRNKQAARFIQKADLIVDNIHKYQLKPKRILEIGCSGALKLDYLSNQIGAECYGIDPSSKAIEEAKQKFPHLNLNIGTADNLEFENEFFDIVIFGFCLYLCDREDLFKIAYEADRCLKKGGFLFIKDHSTEIPYKNKYAHAEGLFSYKMNYPQMFLWNPAYSLITHEVYTFEGYKGIDNIDDRVVLSMLLKGADEKYFNNY